jgi:hypothetical protein
LNNKLADQLSNNINNRLNPSNVILPTRMNMLTDEIVVINSSKLNLQNNNINQLINSECINTDITDLRRSTRIKNINTNKYNNTVDGLHMHMVDVNSSNGNREINNTSEQKQQKCDLEERKEKSSAIYKHQKDMNHHIDWNNSEVVCSEGNSYKLLIKESLIIKAFKPVLNRTTHSVPLHIFPNGVSKQCFPKLNRK